jgi:hypothetical protein
MRLRRAAQPEQAIHARRGCCTTMVLPAGRLTSLPENGFLTFAEERTAPLTPKSRAE